MQRILLIAGAGVVLIIGALLVAPSFIPSGVYKAQIETEGTKALGREVKVNGKVRINLFPRIEARASEATIANPPNFGDKPFASMKDLRAAVKLIPLIFGKVEIAEITLVEPNIELISLENGGNNWTFIAQQPPESEKPKSGGMQASVGDLRIVRGKVSYDDRAAKQIHTLTDFNLRARMKAMDKPLKATASGIANEHPFKMTADVKNLKAMLDGNATDVSIDFDNELVTSDLKGTLALGPKPAFDFTFDGEVPSAPALADAFKVADLPARAVLGKITAKGQALGTPDDITLKIGDARHESPLLNADFKGDVRIAQFITLAIDAKAEAPQLAELAKAMNIEAPAPAALGKATATTKIAGQLGDLKFNEVKFRHEGGLLDMAFDGSAALKADLTYDGHISIKAADLRKLAEAAGSKLPEGNIYRSFSFSGDTSGGTRNVFLTNAVVQFDDIQGKGEAALNFGEKPKLIGTLTTNAIDVTPYATASGAPKDPNAGVWGDTPIDLSPLKLADANLSIRAAGVKFQKFVFGESNLGLKVESGKLTADLKQTELFGGKGNLVLVADGTTAVPAVTLSADIDKLALQPLLRAAADFDMMDGKGDLKMNIAGSGANLQALMSSLAGNGTFVFADGVIKGVDLPELVKQAPNALKNRTIPISAFGNARNTKFNTLNATFAMKEGVAVMPDLKMDAGVMTVTGGGALDIGKQRTSLSLFPEFKNKSDGIKGYGLPMKLEGTWTKVDLSLDYEWLVQRAATDVRARVETEIRDELEKQLGGRLGGILGSRSGTQQAPGADPAPAQQQAAPPASETPAPAEEKPEDKAKREINRALGNLFGN